MNVLRKNLLALSTLALLISMPVLADNAHHKPVAAPAAAAADMSDGEVRKIDLDAAKITLKHGEIRTSTCPR